MIYQEDIFIVKAEESVNVILNTPVWTYILPERERSGGEIKGWTEYGGKWLVYGSLDKIEDLARNIEPYVESGEIVSAKYWNASDKRSAMCVYSLDIENGRTHAVLELLGFKPAAWEYDYARRKNWTRFEFFISAFYKLRILLESFGVRGTLRFIAGAYIKE